MTYKEFIIKLQEYYGVYENINVRKDLYEYLKKEYYESELFKLLENVKKNFSTKWKIQPCIKDIIDTEKEYQVIRYTNGVRMIPECEKKQQIEEDTEPIPQEMFDKLKKSTKLNMDLE